MSRNTERVSTMEHAYRVFWPPIKKFKAFIMCCLVASVGSGEDA